MTENPGLTPDAQAIAQFFAKRVATNAKKGAVNEVELAERLTEIELQTQIAGPSYLKVHIIDPSWALITSGWLEVKEGLLDPIEVEFPEKSGWIWTLCAVEGSTDVSEGNLVCTFEDRIVSYMRQYWGTKHVPPGTQTRAEFIGDLVAEIGQHGEKKITFVCPSKNTIQPLESELEAEGKKSTKTKSAAQEEAEKISKSPGLTAGSGATVGGARATATQIANANILLGVVKKLCPENQVAAEAIMFAAIAESKLGGEANSFTPNEDGYYGVLQGNSKEWPNPNDTKGMAEAFLKGGKGFEGGGAIALSKTSKDPIEIAVKVEVPSIWPANAYAKEAGYSNFLTEARSIVTGNITPGGSGGGEEAKSDVGQLQRGTTSNPDEDSWECCTRLATQVDWFFFSNNERIYYMDGPDFMRQKPALYIDIPKNHVQTPTGQNEYGVILSPSTFSFDNTTFEYRFSHKLKTRVQRKSKAIKPASPAEVKLLLECPIEKYRAGEVFKFVNSGPIDGVWIITDTMRHCFKNTYTEFILEPPVEPLPEPRATEESNGATAPGTASTEGYTNPFAQIKNLSPSRIDMGVDYSGTGNIVAMGDVKVFEANPSSGWEGGAFLGLTLTNGPYSGKSYYHAEELTILPHIKDGVEVKAGEPLATLHGGSESGWATGQPQEALAASLGEQNHHGDVGGTESPAGASFNRLLVSLGCISGAKNPGGKGTEGKPLPPGYP